MPHQLLFKLKLLDRLHLLRYFDDLVVNNCVVTRHLV